MAHGYLNGEYHVRVGLVMDPPYSLPCYDTNKENRCPAPGPGFGIELIQDFCTNLNWICEYQMADFTKYGDNRTGEWNGIVKWLMDNVTDVSFPIFTPTVARKDVIDFSTPLFTQRILMIIRAPEVQAKHKFFTMLGFNIQVWILLMVCVVLVGIVWAVNEKVHNSIEEKLDESKPKPKNNIIPYYTQHHSLRIIRRSMDSLGIFSHQSMSSINPSRNIASEILIIVWALSAVVWVATYSGYLVSIMLVNKVHLPFTSLDTLAECIDRQECEFVTYTLSLSYISYILQSGAPGVQNLKESLEKRPPTLLKKPKILDQVLNVKDHYLVYYVSEPSFLVYLKPELACAYTVVDTGLVEPWAVPINPRIKPVIEDNLNRVIQLFRQQSLETAAARRYLYSPDSCSTSRVEEGTHIIGLESMFGVFLILLLGCLIGSLCLIMEICKYQAKKQKWRKKRKFVNKRRHAPTTAIGGTTWPDQQTDWERKNIRKNQIMPIYDRPVVEHMPTYYTY